MLNEMKEKLNTNERLMERGRYVTGVVLLHVGEETYRLTFERGALLSVEKGPLVMPACVFSISAPAEEWARFWEPVPAPGSHDIFAMLKRGVLRFEGDLHLLMANLFYFKSVFALPRKDPAR